MKYYFWRSLAGTIMLLFIGLALTSCPMDYNETKQGDFSLKVKVNKTRANVGDKIIATVTFKNNSGKDIKAEIPDWLIAARRKSLEDFTVEDILSANFTPWFKFDWVFYDRKAIERPKILIEKGVVIQQKFEHIVKNDKNIEINAGAFFITSAKKSDNIHGMQITSRPLRIRVK